MCAICVQGNSTLDEEDFDEDFEEIAPIVQLTDKDQKYYVHKFGAHFVAGFLKGAKVGNFNT